MESERNQIFLEAKVKAVGYEQVAREMTIQRTFMFPASIMTCVSGALAIITDVFFVKSLHIRAIRGLHATCALSGGYMLSYIITAPSGYDEYKIHRHAKHWDQLARDASEGATPLVILKNTRNVQEKYEPFPLSNAMITYAKGKVLCHAYNPSKELGVGYWFRVRAMGDIFTKQQQRNRTWTNDFFSTHT